MQFVFCSLPCAVPFLVNCFRVLERREWLEIQVKVKSPQYSPTRLTCPIRIFTNILIASADTIRLSADRIRKFAETNRLLIC